MYWQMINSLPTQVMTDHPLLQTPPSAPFVICHSMLNRRDITNMDAIACLLAEHQKMDYRQEGINQATCYKRATIPVDSTIGLVAFGDFSLLLCHSDIIKNSC